MNADILKYYTTGIDAPLCPALTHVTKSCDAACVHQLVDDWLIELPDGKTTMWQVSTCIGLILLKYLEFLEKVPLSLQTTM